MESILTLLLLAVGLSMDAFAVSVCKGLAMKKAGFRQMLIVGLWFGGFQALMPAVGYLLGNLFADLIRTVDHWVAFVLLCLIGGNMIRESLGKEEENSDASLSFRTMLVMAVATSIDALAVGITLPTLVDTGLVVSVSVIGCTTLILSGIGVKVGAIFGDKFKSKAEFAGGAVLIGLGIKILVEHLFFGG